MAFLLKILGIIFLAGNVGLSSIPRCVTLANLFEQDVAAKVTGDRDPPSCHQKKNDPSGKASLFSSRKCSCELLRFVPFSPPPVRIESHIRFVIDSVRTIVFWNAAHAANFILSPEPPYPRS